MIVTNKFFVDERGTFCDLKGDFDFDIKRVYVCENFSKGTIRGFHYHQHESKLFYVPRGSVKFVLWQLTIDEANTLHLQAHHNKRSVFIEKLLHKSPPFVHVMSTQKHSTIYIPKGYANAWKPLEENTILIGCSDRTLQQSIDDDIRIDPDHRQLQEFWDVKNR